MNRVFSAQSAYAIWYTHDGMDWYTNSTPLTKELDPNECYNFVRILNGTDNPELNQNFHNTCFTFFDTLSFRAAIEKRRRRYLL